MPVPTAPSSEHSLHSQALKVGFCLILHQSVSPPHPAPPLTLRSLTPTVL